MGFGLYRKRLHQDNLVFLNLVFYFIFLIMETFDVVLEIF